MILVRKLKFFHLLCLSKIDREKVFAEAPDRKEVFKDFMSICFSKTKLEFFQRG